MKKISLFLLGVFGLFFSSNVYAVNDTPGTYYVAPFDSWVSPYTFYEVTPENEVLDYYLGVEHSRYYYTYYTNETGFGRYSNGNIIPYYRPTTTFPNYFLRFPEFYRETNLYEVDGNWYTSIDVINSRRTDFTANLFCDSNGNCPNTINVNSFRLDFTIRFDFVSYMNNSANVGVTNNITDKIFEGIRIEWVNQNFTTCEAIKNKEIYTLDVTCRGPLIPTFTWSLVYSNVKDYTIFDDSNYHIFMLPSITQGTLVVIAGDRYEELVTDMSPSREVFDSSYSKVENNSNSYFDNFDDFNFGGLTNIVLSPLVFIRSLSSSYYNSSYMGTIRCSNDPLHLDFNIFNNNICVPSGMIFWGHVYGDYSSPSQAKFDAFHITWNCLIGGFIIYKLCVILYRRLLNALDPLSSEEVSSL